MTRAILIAVMAAACGSSSAASDGAPAAQVHAWKPQHGSAMLLARRTMENLEHDPSGPRPDWVLYDPSADQVVFVGAEPGYRRALAVAQSYDVAPPAPPPRDPIDPFASSSYTPDPIPGISKVDDTDFVVERAAIDKILADPMTVAKGARIVPAMKNGVPDGLKLYAIRPSSVYAQLGLANGDTIHAVNGLDISTPDKALEVYTQIKAASSLDVSITRRGTDLVLHYSIK